MSSAMPLVIGRLSWTPKMPRSRKTQKPATATTTKMTKTIHAFLAAAAIGIFGIQPPFANRVPDRPFDRPCRNLSVDEIADRRWNPAGWFDSLSTLAAPAGGGLPGAPPPPPFAHAPRAA